MQKTSMGKLGVLCAIAIILLSSCAAFEEFSKEYDKISPYMISGGKNISETDMRSGWLVGSWELNSSVERTVKANGVVKTHEGPSTESKHVDIFGSDNMARVDVDGSKQLLENFTRTTFGRTDEKYAISVYSLQISQDQNQVVMTKVETQKGQDGSEDSYVYVRKLTRVSSSYSFNVQFDTAGAGIVQAQIVPLGSLASKPADPQKRGMTFGGWYLKEAPYGFDTPVQGDLLLVAKWNKVELAKYSVLFDSDGGTQIAPEAVSQGQTANAPVAPSRDGYLFGGWVDGDGKSYNFSSPVNGNVTLKAAWEQKVSTYAPGFFDTKFTYAQCKDVQWSVSGGKINVSGPKPLYNATTSTLLSEADLGDGSYIRFAKTNEPGYYSQTLYARDGRVKAVLSVKGRIAYWGDYGFLYKADQRANNARMEYCSYFYTNKALNSDGTTPSKGSYPYRIETVMDDGLLQNYEERVEIYAPGFFDTRFTYAQCKDVQWNVSGGKINVSGPKPLYNATTSTILKESDLSDGSYIRFAKTNEPGFYSQTLYARDGRVKAVLSKKGRIAYWGDYGFLYKADQQANNARMEYCSYFYTNKALNPDWTTPAKGSYPYRIETVTDDNLLQNYEERVETYVPGFFDTKFTYAQCKDVKWSAGNGKIDMGDPQPLYNATTSRQLSEADLSDGSYIRFAKTNEPGFYSQTLYARDGRVKAVLSKKGRIAYWGDYGFLYKADQQANNAMMEYCSYFYTNKALNPDWTTPSSSSFSYRIETVTDNAILENFGK